MSKYDSDAEAIFEEKYASSILCKCSVGDPAESNGHDDDCPCKDAWDDCYNQEDVKNDEDALVGHKCGICFELLETEVEKLDGVHAQCAG